MSPHPQEPSRRVSITCSIAWRSPRPRGSRSRPIASTSSRCIRQGLEFSRVYIVGVEDYQIPGLREAKENRQAEIQEARRLLYVGMTRTRERLVLARGEGRVGVGGGGGGVLPGNGGGEEGGWGGGGA